MSMHNILAKLAALTQTQQDQKPVLTESKDALTEATQQLWEKFKADDWEPENEPRGPTKKEKEVDAELKAKGKETAKTLAKIASAFEKKKADESVAESNENDKEWTTGTGGRAVRKGHVTTHYAGKGVYGGSKPYKHGDIDDNDEENNNDNKKEAEPAAPKKRGRPKKVREAALREKAVSRAQQQAAAIAMHAPKSKLKGASKEMSKMPKKELEKFAGTKHTGLPKHVKESYEQLTEGLDVIAHRYGKEMRDFAQTGELAEPLFDTLYNFYYDDMPYGVKKARTDDPYSWISDKLHAAIHNGEVEIKESNVALTADRAVVEEPIEIMDAPMENFDDLNELARLAGLNVTEEKKAKPDFLDVDKDGDTAESMKKALQDKEKDKEKEVKESVDECMGSMSTMGSAEPASNLSVNASYNSADNRKTVSVTAEGEQAEALMQMLKLAGMLPNGGGEAEPTHAHVTVVAPEEGVEVKEEELDEYSNSPDPVYGSTDVITSMGNDLNRKKKQFASKPKLGDNPMTEDLLTLESKLAAEYESIKKATK